MKKRWKKPELVILVRGRVEESVLCSCKGGKGSGCWSGDGTVCLKGIGQS